MTPMMIAGKIKNPLFHDETQLKLNETHPFFLPTLNKSTSILLTVFHYGLVL